MKKEDEEMTILNQDERYEAFVTLLESRLDRSLSEDEHQRIRFLAGTEDYHILRNLFEELGSFRQDN